MCLSSGWWCHTAIFLVAAVSHLGEPRVLTPPDGACPEHLVAKAAVTYNTMFESFSLVSPASRDAVHERDRII